MGQKTKEEYSRERFLSLYEPVHDRLVRYCKVHAYGDFAPHDLVNETVLRAWEHIHKLRDEKAFLHFLFGIARNIMRNHARRRKFRGNYDEESLKNVLSSEAEGETNVDVNLLYEAMEALPEAQKEAIVLFEISGFSIKEITEIQDAGLSAVKARLIRARKALAEMLSDSVVKEEQKQKSAS